MILFAVELVVESRKLLAIIEEVSKAGFYSLVMINYQVEIPDPQLHGYVYGSVPVIRIRLEFEGCFLRSKYKQWMPEEVAEAINEEDTGTRARSGMQRPRRPSPSHSRKPGRPVSRRPLDFDMPPGI